MKNKPTISGLLLAAEWCAAYEGDPPEYPAELAHTVSGFLRDEARRMFRRAAKTGDPMLLTLTDQELGILSPE